MHQFGTARAHNNIALIKYFGKLNRQLNIPTHDTLSLTLSAFYTDTKVEISDSYTEDSFFLNGDKLVNEENIKIFNYLKWIKHELKIEQFVKVTSINHVPTAAGLASSSSGFAALAGAFVDAKNNKNDFSLSEISRLARNGSGSAARSVFGGFVKLTSDANDNKAVASPIKQTPNFDIEIIALKVDHNPKMVPTTTGMNLVADTSTIYQWWIEESKTDYDKIMQAIYDNNFEKFGRTLQENALKMHLTTTYAKPAFTYLSDRSKQIIEFLSSLQRKKLPIFYTMDAGPNIKVILEKKNHINFLRQLHSEFPDLKFEVSTLGPGIELGVNYDSE